MTRATKIEAELVSNDDGYITHVNIRLLCEHPACAGWHEHRPDDNKILVKNFVKDMRKAGLKLGNLRPVVEEASA